MNFLRRIKRLETACGLENTLEAELRGMSDQELSSRIRELEDAIGVEKRWDEMTPKEQEEDIAERRRKLIEEGWTWARNH